MVGPVVTVLEHLPESSKGESRHDGEASPCQGEESGLYSVRKRRRQGLSKRGGR